MKQSPWKQKDGVDYGNMEGFLGTMEGDLRWSQMSWTCGRTSGVIFPSSAQLSRYKQKAEVGYIQDRVLAHGFDRRDGIKVFRIRMRQV